ncbi:MAG: sigma-54-dependent Fis family transcriptional regulator [Planctomycetes bacterium]|nr:sigma-54-dependent Fis family transcriptional regulator [Planctomycetota bacterium]
MDAPSVASQGRPGNNFRVWIGLDSQREAEDVALALSADGFQLAQHPERESLHAVVVDAARADEWLARRAARPDAPEVVIVASFGTIQDAVEAMRRGAFDYRTRPLSPEHVVLALRRAREQRELRDENRNLRESLGARFELGDLASKDSRMRRNAEIVGAIADTRASVLITGESGTGKTLLARTIHARSSRAHKPFVVVDCGAVPASLLESTLFGHARGSFTGAVRDKPGVFEAAQGGTVFLDEITNAPLDLQAKLLRVVQERAFERVGETRTREADVRWIAATHRELPREVAEGRFREDLYWRLNVVALHMPPLRERTGDVPLLAELFLRRFAAEHERKVQAIEPDALAALCAAAWPGNVRQLEHTLERAVLLARGASLTCADLGPEFVPAEAPRAALPSSGDGALRRALEQPERELIRGALEVCGGRRSRAAALLGINRSTLFNKMRKFELLDFPQAGARELDSDDSHRHSARAPGSDA